MINEEDAYIFVHIDKTAGSSIIHALNSNVPSLNKDEPVWHAAKHHNIIQLTSKALREPEHYFKFAFVRNPYDRCLSKYFHHIKTHVGLPEEKRAKELTFPEWVAQGGLKYFRPQVYYIVDKTGKIIVDFIGRFEHLERDFQKVCERLGKPNTALGHVNFNYAVKNRKHYSFYYDENTKSYVRHRYSMDLRAFGYDFEDRTE